MINFSYLLYLSVKSPVRGCKICNVILSISCAALGMNQIFVYTYINSCIHTYTHVNNSF